jgi:hypothetical protein
MSPLPIRFCQFATSNLPGDFPNGQGKPPAAMAAAPGGREEMGCQTRRRLQRAWAMAGVDFHHAVTHRLNRASPGEGGEEETRPASGVFGLRTSVTTSESDCVRAPCSDVTQGGDSCDAAAGVCRSA